MSKKISGAEYKLSGIFSSEFDYLIPSYQRPYAWTADQTLELFDDLYDFYHNEPDDGYFLGSIVLIKTDSEPHAEVIDGQQRLTTLTILFASLTSRLSDKYRDMLYKYIQEPGNEFEGLEPKPRLTLRDRDREFFAHYVQELRFDELMSLDSASLDNEAQRNIQSNSRYILQRIGQSFDDDVASLHGFATFLSQRCYLVAVSTPSQQSAFRVFSVMNSRGLDLQPTDIIKADTIGQISTRQQQDQYNERWEDMEVELGRDGFNDLFGFIRMIYAKEKAKRSLLEEFRAQVLEEIESPIALVEDVLEPYTEALAIISQNRYVASSNAQHVNWYLKWLNRIRNSDWIPPAILFLSQQKNNSDYVLWFFRKLERLAACMYVCGNNVNQRIERYGELIRALEQDHSLDSPVAAVELTDSEKAAFRAVVNSDIYELPARRRNYLLLRLDSFLSDGGASYEPSVLTIEHVLPQTVPAGTEWAEWWSEEKDRRRWVHRLANLVLLNQRRNSSAQNYDFAKKKDAYFSGGSNVTSYALTSQVLSESKWTPETVAERQEGLLEVIADNWELGQSSSKKRRDESALDAFLST